MLVNQIKDQYEYHKCPYNSSHKFHPQKYFYHISKCKDGQKVKHLFKNCQFNPLHIFLLSDICSHENKCPERFQSLKKTNALKQAFLNLNKPKSQQESKKLIQLKKKSVQRQKGNLTLQQCRDECCQLLPQVELIVAEISEGKRKKLKKLLQKYQVLWQKQEKLKKRGLRVKSQSQ